MRETLPQAGQPHVIIEADPGETLAVVDRARIGELYRTHGALLLRGFASDLDAFEAFAAHFCPVAIRNDSRNRASLGEGRAVQSVNLGVQPFPLHPELSREPWKPDAAFFYCLTPPSADGATTICDGVKIVRALPPALIAAMAARRLKYLAPAGPAVLAYWLGTATPDNLPTGCPYTFEQIGAQVARSFTRPLLHKPMFANDLAFGNFLLFARYLHGNRSNPLLDDLTPVPDAWVEAVKAASDALTVPIAWAAGDLLMLDNTRFMHGRTAVRDPDKRLIASYFGYLRDAVPDPEEGPDPVWRKPGFTPPAIDAAPQRA